METSSTIQERKRIAVETKRTSRTSIIQWLDEFARRVVDVVLAGVWLVLLSPAFVMIGLAIRHDTRGPVFYRGKRVGKGGKVFGMLKFRTMYGEEVNGNGSKITAKDDPRITPVGKWLRDNKLNELPQLWNVLVGQMSFVGPRPEDPEIAKGWSEEDRKTLLSVKPGITSPATIIYRDEEQLLNHSNVMEEYVREIMPTKMRLDKLYLRSRSIITDLDVIFWTAVTLLPKVRTLAVPQKYLYWGPLSRLTFRYISWLVMDTLVAFLAVGAAGVIWRMSGPLDVGVDKALIYALAMSVTFSMTNWMLGLNRMEWSRAPAWNVFKLGFSTMLAVGMMLAVDRFATVPQHLPTPLVIFAGTLAFCGFTVMRYRERLVTRTGSQWLKARGGLREMGERVLKVGGGENGALAAWIFEHTSVGKTVHVVGIVDDDPRLQGLNVDGYDVLGTTSEIPELVKKLDIGMIMYTIDNIQVEKRERILSMCYRTEAKVVVLPDLLESMKRELRASARGDPLTGVGARPREVRLPEKEMEAFLGEVQALMAGNEYEAVRERIAAFQEKMHGRLA
jgi:lipopolysaccharide/colanic/teichoic acid biosynthesis glycosyltransferase